MAQQIINIGTTANDGSGSTLRDAFDMINDNFTELYALVTALTPGDVVLSAFMRAGAEVCTGAVGQVITYSTSFTGDYVLSIIDYEGIGIEVTASDTEGFTITSLSAGNFYYIAILKV
jgi:hypothetical protein